MGPRGIHPSPACTHWRSEKIVRVFENTPKPTFSKFSPNETGRSSDTPFVTAPCVAVRPRCISSQNLTQNEMAGPPQSPTARLGCRAVCTTFEIAQKKDAEPVGGRGISAFSTRFFLLAQIVGSHPAHTSSDHRPPRGTRQYTVHTYS